MQMSENGKRLLSQWEGFELKLYKDSAGLDTIGVGHLITVGETISGNITINDIAVAYKKGLTKQQVFDLLAQDLRRFEQAINDNVTEVLNQNQFDALVSFSFNVGVRAFTNSTLLKVLNNRQYDEVPHQLKRWNRSGGRIVQGLVNRRNNEIKLWSS